MILCGAFLLHTLEVCFAAVYTDKWAVQIEGGEEVAKQLAAEFDFSYLGKVRFTQSSCVDCWLVGFWLQCQHSRHRVAGTMQTSTRTSYIRSFVWTLHACKSSLAQVRTCSSVWDSFICQAHAVLNKSGVCNIHERGGASSRKGWCEYRR